MIKSLKLKTVFGIAVILNALVFTVLNLLLESIDENRMQAFILEMDLKIQERKEDTVEITKKNLKDTMLLRLKANSYFVEKDRERGVSDLIGRFEEIGSITGVDAEVNSVNLIDYKKAKNKKQTAVEELFLDLSVKGGWDNVIEFIALTQSIPLKMTVEKISLNKIKDQKVWEMNMIISVLKLK